MPYRRLFAASGWWGPLACAPAYIAFVAFSVWGPVYLEKGLGFSPGATGTLVGVFALIALVGLIVSSLPSGLLVRRGVPTRWSRSTIMGSVVAVAGALILLGLWVDSPAVTVALLLAGFGLTNATNPIGMLTVSEVSPVKQRSATMAVYNSLVTVGGAVASIGVGILADRSLAAGGTAVSGYQLAFAICAVAAIVGGLLAVWLTNAHRDAVRLGLQRAVAAAAAA